MMTSSEDNTVSVLCNQLKVEKDAGVEQPRCGSRCRGNCEDFILLLRLLVSRRPCTTSAVANKSRADWVLENPNLFAYRLHTNHFP